MRLVFGSTRLFKVSVTTVLEAYRIPESSSVTKSKVENREGRIPDGVSQLPAHFCLSVQLYWGECKAAHRDPLLAGSLSLLVPFFSPCFESLPFPCPSLLIFHRKTDVALRTIPFLMNLFLQRNGGCGSAG